MNNPKLAILFWFYKDIPVCINRLKILKKYNPDVKIYGLYGGKKEDFLVFKNKLGKYLDSIYLSPFKDPDWKWINGDLVLLDWYKNCGTKFDFDSIVIIQWDMLFFDSVEKQFKNLKKDEMYLSGYKKLDKYTEYNWEWTRVNPKHNKGNRDNFLNFLDYVAKEHSYNRSNLKCCLFVLVVIPKIFFDNYLLVKNPEIGMLEYKIPIYADIFNIKVISRKNEAHWWEKDLYRYPLNAEPKELRKNDIKKELEKVNGWRVFHPFFGVWN